MEKGSDENDLFALGLKAMDEKNLLGTNEKTAIVVGEKESGKTTLISSIVGEETKGDYKPTVALNYKFGRKRVESKKEVGNFYELGGGRFLSDLVSIPLNADKLDS